MLRGIGLKIGATFAFALMSALVKLAAPLFPVSEVVLFRSIFAMLTLALWLVSRGEWPSALKTTRPFGHIGRSLAGTGGMFSSFTALSLLPLADATAFTFVTPLIVVLLAAVTLGEDVSLGRAMAVAVGFAGVLVMLSSQLGEGAGGPTSWLGAIIALGGAGFAAIAMIQTRRLTRSEATGAIVFYFSAVTSIVGVTILVFAALWPEDAPLGHIAASQRFIAPSALEFAALAAIGILGGCGQILMTHCYRFADASVIAGFDYVTMIWATALGYLLFAETPTRNVLIGAGIVVAAGVGMLWREHQARRIRVGAAIQKA